MERSKFYRFFPPPQFLKMSAIGLDISDASMRFIELVETNKGLVIGRFGEQSIPRGAIESGEVKKPAELRATLSTLKKEHNLQFVAVSLPEEKAYLFELQLPKVKYSELRGAIELALEDHVPIKANEALFDYDIIKEEEMSFLVSVSAIPRTLVDGYLEAFSGTGITPVSFEIEAQSVSRSVIRKNDTHTVMIVDFGRTRTGIAIVSNGIVGFTSTVPVGGAALTSAIAKHFSVSIEEAEKVKQEKGITGGDDNEELSTALMSSISVLRDELRKHYIYWQTHDDGYGKKRPAIEKIYLCGGDSNLAGFVEYLAVGLEVPAALANVLVNVNPLDLYVPEINFGDSLRYATAIGLALRHSR